MIKKLRALAAILAVALLSLVTMATTSAPVSAQGTQRLDTNGNQVNAHDGELLYWNSEYVWIGTSYDAQPGEPACHFALNSPTSQFCGFAAYTSSTGAGPWTDTGVLFDPSTWQGRCAAPNFGCFRPHEAYDAVTGLWVLWANVSDGNTTPASGGASPDPGVQAWTSTSPLGPFVAAGRPALHANWGSPQNYGDLDVFADPLDGQGYAAYTTICPTAICGSPSAMAIAVERLTGTYTDGAGALQSNAPAYEMIPGTPRQAEAPAMFERNGEYYVLYSNPACPYCTGTGTAYAMGSTAMGPYTSEGSISSNSCGGQPDAVSSTPAGYIYQSDQWLGTPNESAANQFWALLTFNADGTIQTLNCSTQWNG